MNDFREKYKVNTEDIKEYVGTTFNPNIVASQISREQLLEFAELVKGTPNKDLLAFKDPKVQELVDYIMAAIIFENERLNSPDFYPIQIYRRYKSDNSMKNKIEDWSSREEKNGMIIPDYLGFKIIPEAEHSIFSSNGDPVLKKMIESREETRNFINKIYTELSDSTTITFGEYCNKCIEVLKKLMAIFPKEAIARKKHYQSIIDKVNEDYLSYCNMFEDSDNPMNLKDVINMAEVNIRTLLSELTLNYPNEVLLYKLKKDLMFTFENSELLRSLRNFYLRFS